MRISELIKKRSDRHIVDIVDKTNFPDTFKTSKSDVQHYVSINPAIDAKFVHPLNKTYSKHRFCDDFRSISWVLPGKGGVGKMGVCAVPHGTVSCEETNPEKKSVYNPKRWFCGKITCAPCWDHETIKQSREKMQRLRGIAGIYDLFNKRDKTLCHVVVSAPPEDAGLIGNMKGYNLVKENAYRIFSFFDMDGYVIFHPCRGKKNMDKSLFDGKYEGDLSDYWTFGPHWHFVGFADSDYIKQNSALFYQETGWIVKVIAEKMEYDYAENVLSYCLTHEGIGHVFDENGVKDRRSIQGIKSIGRFMATKKDGIVSLFDWKERISETCSECGSLIYNTSEFLLDKSERQNEKLTLHHFAFCRREYKTYYRSLFQELTPEFKGIDGRSSPEEFYNANLKIGRWIEERIKGFDDSFEVVISYDLRSEIVNADCDLCEENKRAQELSDKIRWGAPEGFRGQSDLSMTINPIPCACPDHRRKWGALS